MSGAELAYFGIIYSVIGVVAGLMAGILGIGGGIIVVPGLLFVFQYNELISADLSMHVAAGTSLAVMIFTSIAALIAHHKLGEILWPTFNKLWPGIVAGVITGAILADFIPTYWLKIVFALFLFFVAYKMLAKIHVIHAEHVPGKWINGLVSYLIGVKSGLLGVGGGILIIPYLTYCGITPRKMAPVSNLCTLTVGVVGSMAVMCTGLNEMAQVPYATGYVYWPAVLLVAVPSSIIAPFGAKLNYIISVRQSKYGFVVILILTALKMLF